MVSKQDLMKSAANYALSRIKKIKNQQEARLRIWNDAIQVHSYHDVLSLKAGNIVRIDNNIGIVISLRNSTLLMISPFQGVAFWGAEWCEHLPYLNESGNSFDLRTNATSFDNGQKNLQAIEEIMNDGIHSFPSFKFCVEKGNGWYLPSIRELELFKNTELLQIVNEILVKFGLDTLIPNDGKNVFWSSTDNDSDTEYYTSAYALSISTNGEVNSIVQQKAETIKVIPFCQHYIY